MLTFIYIARGLTPKSAQEKIWEEYSYFIDSCRDCFYGVVQLVKWDEDPTLFSFFLREGTTCWLFNSIHGIDYLTPCELDDNLINSVFESDFFKPTQEPGANDIKTAMKDFITSTLDDYKQLSTMAEGYWFAKHFSNAYGILFKQIRVILRLVNI